MHPDERTDVSTTSAGAVRPMRELPNFKVAEGDPDVRGWVVRDDAGSEIGRVHELLVDTRAMRVQSIDVLADGRHIHIPVEQMTTHGGERVVVVRGSHAVTRDEMTGRTGDVAAPVRSATTGQVKETDDEIRIPVVEEELVVEKRPVVKEELVVKKASVTREQKVEADLRRERVDVERTYRNGNPK